VWRHSFTDIGLALVGAAPLLVLGFNLRKISGPAIVDLSKMSSVRHSTSSRFATLLATASDAAGVTLVSPTTSSGWTSPAVLMVGWSSRPRFYPRRHTTKQAS
jgi:hypothetical protein